MDTTQIQTFVIGAIIPIFTLVLKWGLDFITSEKQYTRDRKKIVIQRQIEVMEQSMSNYAEMWEVLYSLKTVLERFSSEPTPAQIELLQRAIEGVNRFQEKSNGSSKAILLYYDFSSFAEEYELEKVDKIILDLSDTISCAFARIAELQSKGFSIEQIKVETEHIANSYHLYADAIECKMKSIVATQDFLRNELKEMK